MTARERRLIRRDGPGAAEELSYTVTLGRRADGAVIENAGVEPHSAYEPTERDLAAGYAGYRDEILAALGTL